MTSTLRNVLIGLSAVLFGLMVTSAAPTFGASFPDPRQEVTKVASSTTYTLATGASARIVATSSKRVSLTVQTINCATGGHLWFGFNDVAAATSTRVYMAASSTMQFGDALPVPYGSIRVLSGTPGCSATVTEFTTTP